MKKKTFLRFLLVSVFLHCISVLLPAQETKRNMLQVKYSVNYFKRHKPSLYHGLFYPDISYKRFFKNKQRFVEFGFDIISIIHKYRTLGPSDRGKIAIRNQFIFESNLGSYLIVTPRLSFMVKAGVAYRFGMEGRINWLAYWGGPTPSYEPIIRGYRYRDFGLGASFEFLYRYGKRWHLSLGGGGQRFLTRRIVTKQQLVASLGVGYAF